MAVIMNGFHTQFSLYVYLSYNSTLKANSFVSSGYFQVRDVSGLIILMECFFGPRCNSMCRKIDKYIIVEGSVLDYRPTDTGN
jgi:hypothetical protein